jgi:hypothetical protein
METHDENGRAMPIRSLHRTTVRPSHEDDEAKVAYIKDQLRRRREKQHDRGTEKRKARTS